MAEVLSSEPTRRDEARELLAELEARGLIEFGAVISASTVRGILGLEFPAVADKRTFDALALRELAATDYVRSVILGRGMYLMGTQSGYRILMPSENLKQVEAYMGAADGKLCRAMKLQQNTPGEVSGQPDQTAPRLMMQRDAIRRRRERLY